MLDKYVLKTYRVPMIKIQLTMEPELLAHIDAKAAQQFSTRSEMMRTMARFYLDASKKYTKKYTKEVNSGNKR